MQRRSVLPPRSILYDGINAVQELSSTSAPLANIVASGLDQWTWRTEGANTKHFLTDALSSTRALTDDAKTISTRYQYEPYGETTTSGAASTNPSQYSGRENDGTGLYYYRARYYHPTLKRFISEDPIGLEGGINTYLYANAAPTIYTDSLGLCPMCAIPPLITYGVPIIAGAVWWISQQTRTPNTGPPGEWHTNPGNGQERLYGPDGRPAVDIDWSHDHGAGSPHGHNWEGGRRGPGTPLSPWPPGRRPNSCPQP